MKLLFQRSFRRKRIDLLPANSFQEMLDPTVGNFFQRVIKWYITPRVKPEITIKIVRFLQLHHFQQFIFFIAVGWLQRLFFRKYHEVARVQSNYTLYNISLASLVAMATEGTVFNEFVHTFGIVICLISAIGEFRNHSWLSFALSIFLILWNGSLVTLQKYTRARLTLVINKAIQKERPYVVNRFHDWLALRPPRNTI